MRQVNGNTLLENYVHILEFLFSLKDIYFFDFDEDRHRNVMLAKIND